MAGLCEGGNEPYGFPKSHLQGLYKIIIHQGIQPKIIRLVKMTMAETMAQVKIYGGSTEQFNIDNGLKQGDALAPMLFNLALHWVITQTGRNNRAPGPDGISNEHLKMAAPILTETWTALLNKCLEEGEIPEEWRKSKLKLLYKGKGDTNNPDSYRGIALESAGLKVLTRAIANRVIRRIEPLLPEEQFGFRPKRSTLMAVSNLLQEIQNAITEKQMKLYVLFIDYQKAFDSVNRQLLMTKLEDMLGRSTLTRLIGNIMAENYIQINDSVGESNWISKNGVLQGDPMSQYCSIY
ncbi:hypothetical protein ANN_26808 [Periplaneta americana]|uniref:Reverse transcriptase domain-containing protein n=1 Tax=Periplaneta americana TaxID=6978 RepID=A0ABQ8RZD9_PERAM|nr:hypothetical protein ANN_26808 [Periplaneta americana]